MEKNVSVDGLNTRYVEDGSGSVVLLLHGLAMGSSLEVYEKNIPALARAGFRAIAFDQPAFGTTDPPKDFSEAYRGNFILKFMDTLGIQKAHMVGHSNTGLNMAEAILHHSDRAGKVVALATIPLLPLLPDQKGGTPEPPKKEPALEDIQKLVERDIFNKSLIKEEYVQLKYRFSTGNNFEAFVQARKGEVDPYAGDAPLWKRFAESSLPRLYLYGKDDRGGVVAKRCALLKEKYPNTNMQLVEGCSHLVMMDQPDEFNNKVKKKH